MVRNVRKFGLQWHITDRCDQQCKICYISHEKSEISCHNQELSMDYCKHIIDDFCLFCSDMRCDPVFTITGGDPLLHPMLYDILYYLKSRNIKFSILGNPFHLDNNVARELKKLGCSKYQLSLDGMEVTHDTIRRKKGSFQLTIQGMEILKTAGIHSAIMSTVFRDNYQEIPDLISLVVNAGVDIYTFARYCPSHDAEQCLSPKEYKLFLTEIWGCYQKLAKRGTMFPLKDHLWTLFLFEKGLFAPRKEKIVFEGCNCGIRHLSLLTNGQVYACRRCTSPIGDCMRQSFNEIFFSKEMQLYQDIYRFEGCKDCPLLYHCRGCHAVSYGTYGDFFAKDPQCWFFEA